jgi:AbrB family looped-hinge helix DNA binding protein
MTSRRRIDDVFGKTYLTDMNAKTVMSAKGQVVIPKDVRDRLGLKPGQQLDVIETAGGVLLRPAHQKSGRSFDEITASIRTIMRKYELPKLTIEQLEDAIAEASALAGRRAAK